jgi:3'-phosphoadenosine 5'-phosphosulfate sulfotransferase (PAPS reductase)/FAD synthetase
MRPLNPFAIEGPALVSFSGGRSSAFMLWRIIQAHGGTLPADVRVIFSNTGKEMPQTLDFVRACADRWNVVVQWLEYLEAAAPADRWRLVDYETASRAGEPFAALIDRKGFLPNPVTRFCTIELKIRPARNYARSLGWDHWTIAIGLRADEPGRVAKARHNREAWDNLMPLAAAGITKADVGAFWKASNFDLALPSINGRTPHGNCDLCFLKSAATVGAIMRDMPERAAWWIERESAPRASKSSGATFRNDRPAYAALFEAVRRQQPFDFGDADELNDCLCVGDA